jgi:hypothetical protein
LINVRFGPPATGLDARVQSPDRLGNPFERPNDQRFADLGVVAVPPNSPSEFAKFIAENIEKWTKVIKFAGIKPE